MKCEIHYEVLDLLSPPLHLNHSVVEIRVDIFTEDLLLDLADVTSNFPPRVLVNFRCLISETCNLTKPSKEEATRPC